jgi:hypothetical protein
MAGNPKESRLVYVNKRSYNVQHEDDSLYRVFGIRFPVNY